MWAAAWVISHSSSREEDCGASLGGPSDFVVRLDIVSIEVRDFAPSVNTEKRMNEEMQKKQEAREEHATKQERS